MMEFRKLCLHMAMRGRSPRGLTLEDYMELRAGGTVKFPEVVKLYLKYLYETTEDERLYHKIRVPAKKAQLPDVLTREQLERLLEACASISFELKALVELLYETGAMVGDILSLRVRDVSFDELGARIRIWRSKSESRVVRVVLYASDLARLVEGREPDEYVFTRNYNTYLRWLTKAWHKAGLPSVRRKFHILRHTRATEVYGRMSEKAMIWFGWRTREMIDVYARVKPEQAEEEYLAALGVAEKRRSEETVVRCPRCGAPNPSTAKYCQRCAMPLRREEQLEIAKTETLMAEILVRLKRLEEAVARKRSVRGMGRE